MLLFAYCDWLLNIFIHLCNAFFQFLTKISVENSSCTCKNLKNRHNVGNCEGKRPMQFNTTTACYVNLPSNCSDLKESMTCPGEMLSTEACNFNELGLTTAMSVTQSIIVAKLQDAAWRGRDSLGQAQNSLLSVYERLQQTFLQHRDTQSF